MEMTIRQLSALVDGEVVGQKSYDDVTPVDITAVLRLMLANVQDYVQSEGISMIQDNLILESLTCSYPGVAGVIEVIFPVTGRSGSDG